MVNHTHLVRVLKIIFHFRFYACGITAMAHNQQHRLDPLLTIFSETFFFPDGDRAALKSEQKMCSPYTHADIRLALFLSNTCWPCSSPSRLPFLSVFKCISSSQMQKSASDSPYQQSIALNSLKISLDLFFWRQHV